MNKLVLSIITISIMMSCINCSLSTDRVQTWPKWENYPENITYSGWLNVTQDGSRNIHFVFLESL